MKSSRSDTTLPLELAEALERVRPRLGRFGSNIIYLTTTRSTNDVAASIAGESIEPGMGESIEPVIVIADSQTAGRGRRGRSWFSPPAAGLYVSVVLAPGRARRDPERATRLLTLAAGVALAEGIATATGLAPDIKWPNDLMIGRRKLAGILAEGVAVNERRRPVLDTREHSARGSSERERASEASGGGARRAPVDGASASASGGGAPREINVVLGYGINVGPMSYPPELADRATSLETELGRPIDRAMVCAETLAALSARYDDLREARFDAILDAWRQRAPSHRGARVSWVTASGTETGITAGIDDRGALLVRVGDRVETIVGGEVTWMI